MSELERDLRSLAAEIAWPPTPRLTPQLAPQLARRRRGALVALVVAALALGVAFVVPGARSAILRFFHLGGVTVERVVTLPPAQKRPLDADLGRLVDSGDRGAGARRTGPAAGTRPGPAPPPGRRRRFDDPRDTTAGAAERIPSARRATCSRSSPPARRPFARCESGDPPGSGSRAVSTCFCHGLLRRVWPAMPCSGSGVRSRTAWRGAA